LIVVFVKEQREAGKSIEEPGLLEAWLRFRAVVMTSIAFISGQMPLLRATGAARLGRRGIPMPLFAAMIAASAAHLRRSAALCDIPNHARETEQRGPAHCG
jgi:multidrug efflux pump subunit AcrB